MFIKVKIQSFTKLGLFGYCSNINLSICRRKKCCAFLALWTSKLFLGPLKWITATMLLLALSLRPVLVILCPGKSGWPEECTITHGQQQASSDPHSNFRFLEHSIQSTGKICKKLHRYLRKSSLFSASLAPCPSLSQTRIAGHSECVCSPNDNSRANLELRDLFRPLRTWRGGAEKILRDRNIIYQFAEKEDELKTVDQATGILTKGQLLGRQIINTAEEFFFNVSM